MNLPSNLNPAHLWVPQWGGSESWTWNVRRGKTSLHSPPHKMGQQLTALRVKGRCLRARAHSLCAENFTGRRKRELCGASPLGGRTGALRGAKENLQPLPDWLMKKQRAIPEHRCVPVQKISKFNHHGSSVSLSKTCRYLKPTKKGTKVSYRHCGDKTAGASKIPLHTGGQGNSGIQPNCRRSGPRQFSLLSSWQIWEGQTQDRI